MKYTEGEELLLCLAQTPVVSSNRSNVNQENQRLKLHDKIILVQTLWQISMHKAKSSQIIALRKIM